MATDLYVLFDYIFYKGMPIEEVYAHILNMSVGIVSLLLATSIRPEPGNPVSGVAMHTHRNRDILFLGTKPGRRLSTVRSMIEKHIITQCGNRANIYSHYQYPLLAHLSFPLYTRNIERGSGDSDLGPGQLSLKSLWPVTLLGPTTSTARYTQEGVDVRSCILSLVDLFSHWLSQPLHTLLLLQTLRAILMLSDLFSLATQFDWMLQLSSDLSDKQPLEDDSIYSLLIHCLLKAAAVVKVDGQQQVEKIVKLTEKALTSDSLHVQNGCLCGLLYVAEDSTSQLAIHLGPLLVKYLPPQLEAFHRNTERHCHLCWSLAVSLSLNHSHLLKDAEFPVQLLDKAIPLLLHPHTSSLLFHSICLGLELMVVNFTFTTEQRAKVTGIAASRCSKCDFDKLLPALGLLVSCMYTLMYSGEQASNENEKTENEMSIQTREHVSVLMEHLRHCPLEGVRFLVDLIPVLITDFFPPVQVLQMVVTEFVSPHQPRPTLAAVIMEETLSLLLSRNMGELVTDWVLLSLDSFVQQEPENKAVWCLVCLLTAASSSSILRAMLEVVAAQPDMPLPHSCALLATASSHFYSSQANNQQQLLFVEKFLSSSYSTLNTVAHACLHS